MELKKIHISDIGKVVTGKTPRTSVAENYGGDIPFLTPSDNLSHKSAPKTIKTLTKQGLNEVKNCLLPPQSVCVSCIGSDLGKVVMTVEPTVTNQQFNSIVPNENFNADFVYYLMSQVGKELNYLSKTSTAVPIINKSSFSNYEVEVPSLKVQEKIASILASLDSKIELNRRINDNLEQQAQTLFKSWLVDFDPFKNGKFVESEMGMIPEGWKVISLQEYCQEITRGNIPTYVEKSNRPILNQKVNKGVSLEKQYYKYNSENVEVSISKMAHYGDVLLNSLGQGTLGRVHLYKEKLGNVIIDQFITILRTNLFVKSAYLSYTLNRPEYQTIIEGNVTGSTGMWVLTINNVRNIKIIVPKESCFLELAPIINSIYQAISNNTAEMEQLCTLRDCILPHLMSGELKINDLNC